MALINGLIPQQNFELIGAQIAYILATELVNQGLLSSPQTVYTTCVGYERFIPVDETEYPFVNVVYARSDYDNKDQTEVDGYNKYYIVGYTSAKTNAIDSGDKRATLKLKRLLGLCRAILENPIYRTLGISVPNNTIGFTFTKVGSIIIPKVDDNGDLLNSNMGYLEFYVKATENIIVIDPIPVGGNDTTVKLYDTEEGFYYAYNS